MTRNALVALALLSIMFGMVMFELIYLVDHLPAWSLLPAFFGAGTVYKFIEILHKQAAAMPHLQPRIVTVEFDWSLLRKGVTYGSCL
jgi:hypothetical protein